jgi:hypothetical protein
MSSDNVKPENEDGARLGPQAPLWQGAGKPQPPNEQSQPTQRPRSLREAIVMDTGIDHKPSSGPYLLPVSGRTIVVGLVPPAGRERHARMSLPKSGYLECPDQLLRLGRANQATGKRSLGR